MKKVVITFGLISGVIIASLGWLIGWLCMTDRIGLDKTQFIGYAAMLIALSMVFFGIKSYRDNYANGKVSFWKGVQIGLLISLISGVLYWGGALAFSVANPAFQAKFIQKYTEHTVGKLQEQGASEGQIGTARENIALMERLFQNPLLFFLVCMIEYLPVGIVVTLISAALLRRRGLLPGAAA